MRLPLLAITAAGDRIVDNLKVRAYLDPLLRLPGNVFQSVEGGHAVQFERPDELAAMLLDFLGALPRTASSERLAGVPTIPR
ncbi:MAG: hypothetical protein K2X03_26345 [Bryobacteraceae bacterium]|nr:hypothetical protein [Bryobacteraceae bacterium]